MQATFARWLHNFKEEAALQSNRVGDSDCLLIRSWLDALSSSPVVFFSFPV